MDNMIQVKKECFNEPYCEIGNICKQLQAKEQECEELKEENAEIKKYQYEQDFLQQQLDQLKAENDDLKKHITIIDDEAVVVEITEKQFEEYKNLKQTLAEIKEIAEKIDDSDGCAYGDYDCYNCSSLEQETVCTYKVKKLIIQKISEVEDEN